jgi:hypothetical protein
MISAETVRALFHYNEDTGVLCWRNPTRSTQRAGCKRKDGYLVIRINGSLYYAHRLVWLFVTGNWPNEFIDHINGNRADNRFSNLRDVSVKVNTQNQRAARKDNKTTRLLGVQRNHSGWQAVITVNGARLCCGTFNTPEAAHKAYIDAKRSMHEGCSI